MKKNPCISIIMPVKEEQKNILWSLNAISKAVRYPYEVLVIYDDRDDPTLAVLKKRNHVRLYKNTFGSGVLQAIKTGFLYARGDAVVVMAADRTDDPETINSMYGKKLQGYDLVCPTRYSKGGKVVGILSLKSVLSRIAGLSTPFFLGIPTFDLTYSFKLFTKKLLNALPIESRHGFAFAEELVVKAFFKGYKIVEVPTVWNDRQYGKSKFRLWYWLPQYIYWYIWGIRQRCKI